MSIDREILKKLAKELIEERGSYHSFEGADKRVIYSWRKGIEDDTISDRILLDILNQKGKLKVVP